MRKKRDILIFKTINKQQMELVFKKISALHDNFYIVMPDKEINLYDKSDPNIQYIGTGKEYMDYHTLMQEAKIPDIKFHEIWVLSSSYDRLYSYYEVYAVIPELKYYKLKYLVIKDGKITIYDLEKERIFSGVYALLVEIVRVCIGFKNRLIK